MTAGSIVNAADAYGVAVVSATIGEKGGGKLEVVIVSTCCEAGSGDGSGTFLEFLRECDVLNKT